MTKYVLLALIALVSLSMVLALDPPTDAEKQYFKDNLKTYAEKEFSGIGITMGANDMQTSIYVYKRQTLDNWTQVFRDAFALNYGTWTEIYDYVLEQISLSNNYETYGYLNVDNTTYWLTNTETSTDSFSADVVYQNDTVGSVELHPLFWSFWTGSADLDGDNYKMIVLRFKS